LHFKKQREPQIARISLISLMKAAFAAAHRGIERLTWTAMRFLICGIREICGCFFS
jgi:hypothetical protein